MTLWTKSGQRQVCWVGVALRLLCRWSHQWRCSFSGLTELWKSHNKTDGLPFPGLSQMLRVALDRWCCSWTVIAAAASVNTHGYNSIICVIMVYSLTNNYKWLRWWKKKKEGTVYIVKQTRMCANCGFLFLEFSSGQTGMLRSPELRQHQWVEDRDTLFLRIWRLVPGLMD